MAVTITNNYFMETWAAWQRFVTTTIGSGILNTNQPSYSLGWVPAVDANGGYFFAHYFTGATEKEDRYYSVSAITGGHLPVSGVSRQNTMSLNTVVGNQLAVNPTTKDLAVALLSAWQAMSADVCGTSSNTPQSASVTLTGLAKPSISYAMGAVWSATDLFMIVVAIQMALTPPGTNVLNNLPTYGLNAGLATFFNLHDNAQVEQMLPDFTMALNNNSAIFSMSSGTITEP